jgi:hypothetical protein
VVLKSRRTVPAPLPSARKTFNINQVACACVAEQRAGRWHGSWHVDQQSGATDVGYATAGRALGAAERSMREYLARTTRVSSRAEAHNEAG